MRSACGKSLCSTSTQISRSPFVRAPGVDVNPMCSISASGSSAATPLRDLRDHPEEPSHGPSPRRRTSRSTLLMSGSRSGSPAPGSGARDDAARDMPKTRNLCSPSEWSGSGMFIANASPNTVMASSNDTLCLRRFAAARDARFHLHHATRIIPRRLPAASSGWAAP